MTEMELLLEDLEHNANANSDDDCYIFGVKACKMLLEYIRSHELALQNYGKWIVSTSTE